MVQVAHIVVQIVLGDEYHGPGNFETFNLFSFSKIICSLKINSLIGEWQGLTGRDKLLCSFSTVNTLEKNLPNSSALSLFELTVVELPEISTICQFIPRKTWC